MRIVFAALMLVSLSLVAIACGGDDDIGATPTPPTNEAPATDTPAFEDDSSQTPAPGNGGSETPAPEPGLFIVDMETGEGTTATPGTRCWYGVCVDYIGPITADEPVTLTPGAELGWQVEGGTAETVSHTWIPRSDVEVEDTGAGTLAWQVTDASYSEGTVTVPEEPGEYLLSMFIRYASGDDVLWGLYVNVE